MSLYPRHFMNILSFHASSVHHTEYHTISILHNFTQFTKTDQTMWLIYSIQFQYKPYKSIYNGNRNSKKDAWPY